MGNDITWLHISDIHFCHRKDWRDKEARATLIDHLNDLFVKDESVRPDFIFCTGDIAYGETLTTSLCDQYAEARIFFDRLLSVCGKENAPLPKRRLFVVPGNHDVNRMSINQDAQLTLTSWAAIAGQHVETMNQRFNDCSTEFKDTIKRLNEYEDFVKDYLPHQYDENGRSYYTCIEEVDGTKVGIAGFNSAWSCAGPEDDRNIWLAAEWQFNSASESLRNSDIRIGLIHHPIDWLNAAEREEANQRIASDYDFWLHGHLHNAWVTPVQSHIILAAGAVGTNEITEFGVNLTTIDISTGEGTAHLHNRRKNSNGWTLSPIPIHAPSGKWHFKVPSRACKKTSRLSNACQFYGDNIDTHKHQAIDAIFTKRLNDALVAFSTQPIVWVSPVLCQVAEVAKDVKSPPPVDLDLFCSAPVSTIVKAPPQYGLTCLAYYLIRQAWRTTEPALWVYLDAKNLKPHPAAIEHAIHNELTALGCAENDIKCVVLDSWAAGERDAFKLLSNLSNRFRTIPIICMQQIDGGLFANQDKELPDRVFEVQYLWSLPMGHIRQIVSAYNQVKPIGDEDAVINRLVSDLSVLNLHRTPMNCLTLLKVSEVDFEESPVNRSEMIKRVLFAIFNLDQIPTYKSRPDLKDCEYVLGYFSEVLIREGNYLFSRDQFLLELQRCCRERLIDLETQVVFDILYANNIIIKRGGFYSFRFAYWIFYFAAQRMHHDTNFAGFIFDLRRYSQHPEIIEFYTGIDRQRDDALEILIRDIKECRESVKEKIGFPDEMNPYKYAKWETSPEAQEKMQKEIADGISESNLPPEIKDKLADRHYDRSRPYDQTIKDFFVEHTFASMLQTMTAGARALRNSDYASPATKRRLLIEIVNCWEQASKVLFILLPILAEKGRATFDGTGFVLVDDFGSTPEERIVRILGLIPANVVSWSKDDLFSQKMGPLLHDYYENKSISDLQRHELVLLLIQQRPREWQKTVQNYVAAKPADSFYLMDVYLALRAQYRFGYASPQTLRDIEYLIKMVGAKHVTGHKNPGVKTIGKVKFDKGAIPEREV